MPSQSNPDVLDDPVGPLLEACLRGDPASWWDAVELAAARHPNHAGTLRARFRALFELEDLAAAAPALPRAIGDLVVLEELGRGGMGIVYRAHEPSLDREVAVKVVRPSRLTFEGAAARFEREALAMARLAHPGVVTIHRVGIDRGIAEVPVPFLTMELLSGASVARALGELQGRAPESLDGADLFRAIGGEGPPPACFDDTWPRAVARVVRDVARALEHAHGRDVVHRDVKPSNIAVERDGRAVLLDFGLTASTSGRPSDLTRSGGPLGTYAYMAPEQWRRAADSGPATDVYGLGATLYELLALAPPFQGEDALSLRAAVEAGDALSLRARNREVPRDLALVQAKAMDPVPARRYRSAAAFAEDLDRFLAGDPVGAAPPGALALVARRVRRHPAAAAAWALTATLALGGPLAFGILSGRHARDMGRVAAAEREARVEEAAARREAEDVLAFTVRLFEAARPELHDGYAASAVDMLHAGARSERGLDAAPRSAARIDLTLGRLFSLLAEPRSAAPPLERAVDHYRRVAPQGAALAEALRLRAHNRAILEEGPGARSDAEESLALATGRWDAMDRRLLPHLATLADVCAMTGDVEGAVAARERAVQLAEAADTPVAVRWEARGLLGVALLQVQRRERGRELAEGAVAWARANAERSRSTFWAMELALVDDALATGDVEVAVDRATRLHRELEEHVGAGSLLSAQAGLLRGRTLAARGEAEGALDVLRGVDAALSATLPAGHALRLDVDRNLIGVLTALGRSDEVLALEDARSVAARSEAAAHVGSEDRARLRLALGMAAQARGRDEEALAHLQALESLSRELAPWSGPHGDAALLLVAHRVRMGPALPDAEHARSAALLEEMIEAIGAGELPVTSSANGQTYEGGTMARHFLAGLLDLTPDGSPRAAALRAEAAARQRAIQSRAGPGQ